MRLSGLALVQSNWCHCKRKFGHTKKLQGWAYTERWPHVDTGREKAMAPTPVLLTGKSHGQRSQVGCSPCSREESHMTERLHFLFSLSCIGEGNGNLLQCSCLENPRHGGAWWAAVYGVAHVGHDWSDLAAAAAAFVKAWKRGLPWHQNCSCSSKPVWHSPDKCC